MAKIFGKTEEVKEEFKGFFDQNDTADGFEGINSETMAIPWLKIAQTLSPAMKENKPEYIEGLKVGDFYNSVTKEIYGSEVQMVVGKFDRGYVEWLPKRKGFVASHTVEEAEEIATDHTFGKWKIGENILQENYVYFVILLGHENDGVMIMSLSSTQIKKAKAWNKQLTTYIMKNGEKALPYYLKWRINTVEEHKEDNDWYGIAINGQGLITDESLYLAVKDERKLIEHKRVDYAQIDDTSSKVMNAESEDGDVDY